MNDFNFVCNTFSLNDQMIIGTSKEQYLEGGKKALEFCLDQVSDNSVSKIIDFPSGHGRVMRWLKYHWPFAELFAVDIDDEAIAFCKDTFGAIPIRSTSKLYDVKLPDDVDLIWSGSLLTHFNDVMWDVFFGISINSLKIGGILIFTFHGRIATMLAERSDPVFGNLIDLSSICNEYHSTGFSYRDYDPLYPVYGLAFSSPSWVIRKLESYKYIKIIAFVEGAWGYQDIIAVKKLPTPI
jgi:cyclopropane fatty-acyl-phospholipid synthase-like methyltransferase